MTPLLLLLAGMSVEEKVGQVLMAHFHGEVVNNEAKTLLEEVHIGGIIYYPWANGLTTPTQVQQLSTELQESAHIPLFIGVDQEGGRVSRLTEGFTHFYGNGALGITGDAALAEQVGVAMGEELAAVGINLNFAPVVDVSGPEEHPLDHPRSFGSNPECVARLGEGLLKGLHHAGVLATLKHFPGHGDVSVDSHLALPVVTKSLEALWKTDLYPFAELLDQADMIMTAHLVLSAVDPVLPATISPLVIQKVLREEIGYQGVIITDSLMMEGLLKNVPNIEEASLQAFEAGCDILLLGGKQLLEGQEGFELSVGDVVRIHRIFVEAVRSGRISEERLDCSVKRILSLKEKLSLKPLSERDLEAYVGTPTHLEIAREVFDRSLRCAKPVQPVDSDP